MVTLLAMQVLVAWVSHSRERMPVSSRTVGAAGAELRGQGAVQPRCPPRARRGEGAPSAHLQHVQGSVLVALPHLDLANEAG